MSSTVRHQPFHRHVTAPSVSTHPKQKTPKNKGGWVRREAEADIGWVHGSKQSKHVALERWLIDTPWWLEPPKAIQQNPSRWEHGGWMDVPVRIEEASYVRTRCKQRWEWVHGSKPVTLVRWQAGKAVNASRFPCASPSAKAEGSADFTW